MSSTRFAYTPREKGSSAAARSIPTELAYSKLGPGAELVDKLIPGFYCSIINLFLFIRIVLNLIVCLWLVSSIQLFIGYFFKKMALRKVRDNLDRLFDKNLTDLIRGIRNNRENEVRMVEINCDSKGFWVCFQVFFRENSCFWWADVFLGFYVF